MPEYALPILPTCIYSKRKVLWELEGGQLVCRVVVSDGMIVVSNHPGFRGSKIAACDTLRALLYREVVDSTSYGQASVCATEPYR